MIAPTSGDAVINGMSIRDNMGTIRQNLGVCPQFDILWPDITVGRDVTCAFALCWMVMMPRDAGSSPCTLHSPGNAVCCHPLLQMRPCWLRVYATGGRASGAVCSHQGVQPQRRTAHREGGCCGCWYAHDRSVCIVCTSLFSTRWWQSICMHRTAQSSRQAADVRMCMPHRQQFRLSLAVIASWVCA
jgi:hypothetical protein